jgi:hypothetical protein
MKLLGYGGLAEQAQRVVRHDPRFTDVLAVEDDGTLVLYQTMHRPSDPAWAERYVEWARLSPAGRETYRLAHLALFGRWQELDVERQLETCIQAIADNKYHLFFV